MRTDAGVPVPDDVAVCAFCGATALRLVARGLHHPRVASHGAVDIHECDACGSMVTWPVPSEDALRRLYAEFAEGIDPRLRRLRGESPSFAWYAYAARRATRAAGVSADAAFTWMDIGAGAGEIGEVLKRDFPNARGTSIDWHGRPVRLAADARHDWTACNLNAPGFAATIGIQADLVITLSVWEHVRHPAQFVRDASALVKPGGTLYLVCPDYGSAAARVLGRRWPYWIPGEHLHMPTQRGARICIERAAAANGTRCDVFVRSVGIPYPPSYVCAYLGLPALAGLLRAAPALPLPVGALEAGFIAHRDA